MDFVSYIFKTDKPPAVHISQYTSSNRQMSILCGVDDDDPGVTIPWLLSPGWRASYKGDTIRTRASQLPGEAIKSIHQDFQYLQSDFFCPRSLEFKDGKPVVDRGYVEILGFKRECNALVAELRGLRVSEQYQDQRSKEISAVSKAVQEIDSWVEEQRTLALAEEEQVAREAAEKDKIKLEQDYRSLGPTILRFSIAANKYFIPHTRT
ncbi:hypothetical protein FRC10_004085 [Ceratobasidium sp. 414]|nr:hypothetical protein FRC10_004085 [Ceratobasidium sp. 414]